MDVLWIEDPFSVINHAYTHEYCEEPGFEWIKEYLQTEIDMPRILNIFNTHTKNEKNISLVLKFLKLGRKPLN